MKLLKATTLKDGRKRVLIEFRKGESTDVIQIPANSYFTLGYPLDDQVIESHHLTEIKRVAWDAFSQKWVEA